MDEAKKHFSGKPFLVYNSFNGNPVAKETTIETIEALPKMGIFMDFYRGDECC